MPLGRIAQVDSDIIYEPRWQSKQGTIDLSGDAWDPMLQSNKIICKN